MNPLKYIFGYSELGRLETELTLRDLFAGLVLAGMSIPVGRFDIQEFVETAYSVADAMLVERARSAPDPKAES